MSEGTPTDALHNLVKFLIALAVLGIIIALIWYFGVEVPAQQAAGLHVPQNMCSGWRC